MAEAISTVFGSSEFSCGCSSCRLHYSGKGIVSISKSFVLASSMAEEHSFYVRHFGDTFTSDYFGVTTP